MPNIRKTSVNINHNLHVDADAKPLITLWILRALNRAGLIKEFVQSSYFKNENIAEFLGLVWDDKEFDEKKAVKDIKELYIKAEKESGRLPSPEILSKNIKKLTGLVGLNSAERTIMQFVIMLNHYELLEEVIDLFEYKSLPAINVIFASILDLPVQDVKAALSFKSSMIKSGIVTIDRYYARSLKGCFELITNDFASMMYLYDEDVTEFIKEVVRKNGDTALTLADFRHIKDHIDLLKPYLSNAVKTRKKGVNILIYGIPGTGKTEFCKALAREIGLELYEVSFVDEDNDPIEGRQRLKAYKAAQGIFAKKSILLMFDETEDVFNNDDFIGLGKPRQKNKAWLNRMLEENTTPTIWITNNVYNIDNAILRRFDMNIEMPVPSKKKRTEIIHATCSGLLSEKAVENIALNGDIAPALLSRAAALVSNIKDSVCDSSKAVELLLNETLKAQGYGKIQKENTAGLPGHYDPCFINTPVDLKALSEGIRENPNARLCLYGPPGTGKSAYGKYLADLLEKPLILKKGSDLLSMWVGGTEKNIASAFEEASEENGVLVFDEVDSFLQDRRDAQKSWEVTQVNEMLTQMESFDGIFLATTNLMDNLDQAAIRRFDMKMEFGYMRPEQAWALFIKECETFGIDAKERSLMSLLQNLGNLTPGDFAAIRRRNRFEPVKSAEQLAKCLVQECSIKNDSSGNKMGFML